MRALTLSLCLAVSAAVVAAPVTAHAKKAKPKRAKPKKAKPKKMSKRDRTRAKKAFERGYKLFQELDYKQALKSFQESYNLSGFAGVLYYIGLCYQKLGNYRVSIAKLEDFLRLDQNAPESEHDNARGQIEDMKKRLAEEDKIREQEREEAEARLQANLQSQEQDRRQDDSLLKSWKFWTVVGVVAVAGGVTTYLILSSDDGIPDSDLGNIDLRNTALLRF
jgi:tetratricopeptide (TPR) repeat protein